MTNELLSGFAAIAGRPNAGKSTLINKIVGRKIAITSSKPQTTRHAVLGVYSEENLQIVFVDTPGIHRPRTSLGKRMEKSVRSAVSDVDVIVYIMDASRYCNQRAAVAADELQKERNALKRIMDNGAPVILALNKTDKVNKELLLPLIAELADEFEIIVPISAQKGGNVNALLGEIKKFMKPGVKYFPDGCITDQTDTQFISEIIREKALRLLNDEIPHGIAVEIEKHVHDGKKHSINAAIYCEKDTHKGIIIGKGGERLKAISSNARMDIEKFLGDKVYLEVWVRVKENWRNKEGFIKEILDRE